jgi:hypothetical protein
LAYTDNVMTDPGTTDDYLDTTVYGSVQIFTAAATRKLANAESAGNELMIVCTTGDDVVITADTDVNVANNNTMTLSEAEDWILLRSAIPDATNGGYKWVIVENANVGLSTV